MKGFIQLLFLQILFALPIMLFAQDGFVKGKVTDSKTKEPLIGVNVISDKGEGAATDFDGNFNLKLAPGNYKITFRYIGYADQVKTVTLLAEQSVTLNIALAEEFEELELVVVSASKYEKKLSEETVSIEVMKQDLIQNTANRDMEEAMNRVPGVTVVDGQANIRGGSGWSYGAGSRVMVLVDDLPLLSADAADAKWGVMPIENIEQVEVIKGAASSLYGSSALNGIINVRTAWPKSKPYTQIVMQHGIVGNPRNLDAAWWRGEEKHFIDWRTPTGYADSPDTWVTKIEDGGKSQPLNVSELSQSEYYQLIQEDKNNGSTANWSDNKKQKEVLWGGNHPMSANFSIAHRRKIGSQFDLVLGANYFAEKSHLYGGSFQSNRVNLKTRYRAKKIEGLAAGINVNYYNSAGSTFFLWDGYAVDESTGLRPSHVPLPNSVSNYTTLRLAIDPYVDYFIKDKHRLTFKARYFNTRNLNDTQQGSVPKLYYGELQYQKIFPVSQINLIGGVSGFYSDVRSPSGIPEESLIGNHTGNNISGYLQADKKFFETLSVTLGMRYEYFRIDTFVGDSKPVMRIGVNYQASEGTFIRASFGQGYRFPTIAEKFVNTNIGAIGIYPNPILEPETGWSAELAVKQLFKIGSWKGFADLAGFVNKYQNMMEFTFGQVGVDKSIDNFLGLGFSAQNIGSTRILGTEFSLATQGKVGPFPLSVMVGYTFIDPKSLNWNDTIMLYDEAGNLVSSFDASNGERENFQTYAGLSTSEKNVLKYRHRHLVKADLVASYKKFDLGFNLQYQSFMENIDYFFVSPFLTGLEGVLLETSAFSGLEEFRKTKTRGDIILDLRLAYNITEDLKFSFIIKNLLNEEYTRRPAFPDPPRSFLVQVNYRF